MKNVISNKQSLLTIVSLVAFAFPAINATAAVYKWRNERGVVQYSDKPPVTNFTKATKSEIVNSLQTKDLCAPDLIAKNSATKLVATNNISANFFGSGLFPGSTSSSPKPTSMGTVIGGNVPVRNNIVVIAAPKPIAVAPRPTSPIATAPKPIVPVVTAPKPQTPAPVVTLPIAAAPKPPATVPPLVVANNSPPPATTPAPSTTPNIVQQMLMPAVDISKNMTPAIGSDKLIVSPTSEIAPLSDSGSFRISCRPSHMSNDDPIVYPNQQGAAHHHTFYGNTSTDYKSNLMTFSSTGNSTCSGGILNRSAYWAPSMIDTTTKTPMPADAIFYYKTGYGGNNNEIQPPPKGLRMIAGNAKGTDEASSTGTYTCLPPNDGKSRPFYGWKKSIPNCDVGWEMEMGVGFPSCWDGKNLDSPNHKDHMAFTGANSKCPASHPVRIPEVSVNYKFKITKANQALNWRLASDNYSSSLPGGYSAHSDWVNGWEDATMAGIVKNCLRPSRDGHAHLLCDGRMFY